MKSATILSLSLLLIWAGCESAQPGRRAARATQESVDFPVRLPGKPGLRVTLDRRYDALYIPAQKGRDCTSYMLGPKDDQSSLLIGIGEQCTPTSDAERAKEPGFTGIQTVPAVIAGEKVTWRRWANTRHLYSECSVRLIPVDYTKSSQYRVSFYIVANTDERRKALEEHVTSIQLEFIPDPEEGIAEPSAPANGALPRR